LDALKREKMIELISQDEIDDLLDIEEESKINFSHKEFNMNEGGNVTIKTKGGNVYSAEKIPIKSIGREKFIKEFSQAMKKMNRMFFKKNKEWIWDEDTFFKGGLIDSNLFNGSTSYMMDQKVPDDIVLDLKPTMGDIDIVVPEQIKGKLWVFLKEIEDTIDAKLSDEITFLGDNKPTESVVNDQINALFKYIPDDLKDERHLIQVDFEFVVFEEVDDQNSEEPTKIFKPSEFAKFGHSSTIQDLEAGIKAVFHKYLLRALSYGVSLKPEIIQVTKMATPNNWEKKIKKNQGDTMVKFSVSKGVRMAYEPLLAFDGSPITDKEGNLVFKEIPTSNSAYKKVLPEIFEMFFNRTPSRDDIKNMWSFVGVVELIKKYLNQKQIHIIIERYFQLLWELKKDKTKNIGQELERDSAELDFELKNASVDYLEKELHHEVAKVRKEWEKDIEIYYKNYGDRGESLMLQALAKARMKK